MTPDKRELQPGAPLLTVERPQHPEQATWKFTKPVPPSIRIAGQAGAGKTTIADALSRLLGLPIVKVGQQDRNMVPTDTGYRKREDGYDREIDRQIEDVLKTAHAEEPTIVEANLALAWGKVADAKRPTEEQGISILVVADEEKRVERIWRRQNRIREQREQPLMTPNEVRVLTRKRHRGNLNKWQRLYGDKIGMNDPHQPSDEDRNNPRFIVIDTTNVNSEEETIALTFKTLVEQRLIERTTPVVNIFNAA
jgi:cytidylate kinase